MYILISDFSMKFVYKSMNKTFITLFSIFSLFISFPEFLISKEDAGNSNQIIAANSIPPKESSNNDNLHYNLGILSAEKKDWNEAIKEFSLAISINPKNFFAYYARASVFYELNKKDSALDDLNKLIKINSKFDKALRLRAVIYQQKSNYSAAIDDYLKLAKIDPENSNIFLNLANCYQLSTQKQKAKESYLKAEKLGGSSEELFYNLSVLYYEENDFETAMNYVNKIYFSGKINEYSVNQKVQLHIQLQECDSIVYYFEKHKPFINDKSDVLLNIGVCYLTSSQFDKAVKAFTDSYSENKSCVECLYNRAIAYLKLNKIDLAIADFNLFIDSSQDRTDLDKLRTNASKQVEYLKSKK